jgi:phosphoglycerate dehydrogenase-like enzyme
MNTILIALKNENVPPDVIEKVRALQPGARLVITEAREAIDPLLDEIEIAVGHFPASWIARAPRLRWFQQWGAGADWLMRYPEIAEKAFILTNVSGVHAIPISEHILAFLLAFARRLPEAMRAQAKREWKRDGDAPAFELAGKTMLLVGVGAIGRRTARIAAALGMRVLAVRRDASRSLPDVERVYRAEEIEQALPEADFVVLTMPLTSATRNMFNARLFARMKPGAFLINIGRGGTVDEPALVEALRSGHLGGAGLDVTAVEPLPPDSPLWELPNVIITGHYSGETPHYDERALAIFLDNLERYTTGQPMRNVVDKQKGY